MKKKKDKGILITVLFWISIIIVTQILFYMLFVDGKESKTMGDVACRAMFGDNYTYHSSNTEPPEIRCEQKELIKVKVIRR
jgi:hypothetical protein